MKISEDIYRESTATRKLHKVSNKIQIQKGIRQGDTITPKLFTVVLEEVLRTLNGKRQEF